MQSSELQADQNEVNNLFEELKNFAIKLPRSSVSTAVSKLMFLRDKPIKLNSEDCREKIQIIDQVLSKIKSYGITDLKHILSALPLNKFFIIDNTITGLKKSNEEKTYNENLAEILVCAMVKSTQKEIENSVDFYFNETKTLKKKFDHIRHSLKNIYELENNKQDKLKTLQYFIYTIYPEDSRKILAWFISKEIYDPFFFYILYIKNNQTYTETLNIILSESFYKRKEFFEIVPYLEIDFETVELNPEIINTIFSKFPKMRHQIISFLQKKEKKRQWLINIIINYYDIFDTEKIDKINLTDKEHIHLCTLNPKHLIYTYNFLSKNYQTSTNNDLYIKYIEELIKNKEVTKEILLLNKNQDDQFYLHILKLLCTTKRLDNDMITFLKENFMDIEKFFYIIACQLPKQTIFHQMESLLKTDASLLNFVALLPLREIYTQIHFFLDQKNQIHCANLIKNRKDLFDQNVSIETLRYLVKENKHLPNLFFRTIIVTLTLFPKSKDKIIRIIIDSTVHKFWKDPILLQGFIKTILYLKTDGIEILLELPQDQIENIICRNKTLLKIGIEYMENKDFISGKNGLFFKKIILRERKRCKL